MDSVSNWETLWIALAGGAVGSILTALIAYGAKFWSARSEIAAHDRAAHERDQDLESWVADRSRVLRRELREITEWHNAEDEQGRPRNLHYSGAHGNALARAKERALHEYRDEERQALRDVAHLREAEGRSHAFWRKMKRLGPPELTAHQRVFPFLDYWRSSVTRHGDPPIEVRDPTRESFQEAITDTQQNSRELV